MFQEILVNNSSNNQDNNVYITRPPIFNGEGYPCWEARMKTFIEVVDMDIWEVVASPYVPKHVVIDKEVDKSRSLRTDEEKKKVQLDLKAKNIITIIQGL